MNIRSTLAQYFAVSALALAAAPAMAACTWESNNGTPKQLTLAAGTVFAPRDVPIGTTLNNNAPIRTVPFNDRLVCGLVARYSTTLIGPLATNIPVDVVRVPASSLLQTNVPASAWPST